MSKLKFSFSVLDRFIHDVQKPIAHPTVGDAKRASSAVDEIINSVHLIDELNVQGLRDLIKLAEKGKFTDMKNKIPDAVSDYQIIESFYKKKVLPPPVDPKKKEDSTETEKVLDRPRADDLLNSKLLNSIEENERKENHSSSIFLTDIGDINRPTKLAEQFSALYDNEWTDAFDAVARTEGKKENIEREIIVYLADVLRNIFEYAGKRAHALVDNISTLLEQTMLDPVSSTKDKIENHSMIHSGSFNRYAKQCVKETAKLSIPALAEDFKKNDLRPGLQKFKEGFDMNKYIDKCLEICWLMNVHDPPMFLKWPTDTEKADDILECFRYFTKPGIQLDYPVWPALLLHDDGPLLVKGVVQMK